MKIPLYIGIDPGKSGAIALITAQCKILELEDWPGDENTAAGLMWAISERYPEKKYEIVAAIEQVHSMPGQGISSSFKFGTNFGIWRMALAMLAIPFILVTPQKWQKGLISKDDKMLGKRKGSCVAAARLFPKAELYGPQGGAKDGRADALMIADWRRRS